MKLRIKLPQLTNKEQLTFYVTEPVVNVYGQSIGKCFLQKHENGTYSANIEINEGTSLDLFVYPFFSTSDEGILSFTGLRLSDHIKDDVLITPLKELIVD